MRRTLREVLDVIDEALIAKNEDASRLWDVLTALRGPDTYDGGELKSTGTIPIRRAAFPKVTKQYDNHTWYANSATFNAGNGHNSFVFPRGIEHIQQHICNAAVALELHED